jgi:hypothetical protein
MNCSVQYAGKTGWRLVTIAHCTGVLGRSRSSRSWRCRTIGHPGIALHLLNLPLPFLGLLEQKAPKDLPAMLAKFKKSNVKIDRTLTRVTASERRLVALAMLTLFSERHRLC